VKNEYPVKFHIHDTHFLLPNNILCVRLKPLKDQFLYDFSDMEDQEELQAKLAEYQSEHKALDHMIEIAMASDKPVNLLHMQQLKKKKLWLKDMIKKIESDLIDDIIA